MAIGGNHSTAWPDEAAEGPYARPGHVTGDPEKQQLELIRNARQLAFLITDLQDSTAMASANAAAFRKVQDIHDTVSLCVFID